MHVYVRALALVVAGVLLVGVLPAGAQAPGKVYRIAILSHPNPPVQTTATGIEVFRQGLRELGWIEGRNVVIEQRHTDLQRIDEAATRIVSERFDLIVTVAITSARRRRRRLPRFQSSWRRAPTPVGVGLVDSLARPGGNVTGLSFVSHELRGKRLELLKEMVLRLGRVGALYHEAFASHPFIAQWLTENERAARALELTLRSVTVKEPFNWEATFGAAKRDGVQALTVTDAVLFITQAPAIAAAAVRHRLPAVFPFRDQVEAGGLMAYGASRSDLFRRAATYVDKILRGAKPADLPIEQSTKFELVINAKTAKALGLAIPPRLRLQATEVIE